jgi:hypothetical protein
MGKNYLAMASTLKEYYMITAIDPVHGASWRVSIATSFPSFLNALPALVPTGAVLYIESGGSPPKDILSLLKQLSTREHIKIPAGTLFPRPSIYTVPVTRSNMQKLAAKAGQYPTPAGALHLHVYLGTEMLLSSYDAFLDPFYISLNVPEERVAAFCDSLACSYERVPIPTH